MFRCNLPMDFGNMRTGQDRIGQGRTGQDRTGDLSNSEN